MRMNSQALQIGSEFSRDGHVKLYFLEGDTKAIIDTGIETSPERDIAPYLAHFGYKLDDIDIILNTHGHLDHANGNPFIPRAEVWIHEEDAFYVEDPAKAFDSFYLPNLRLKSESRIETERARHLAGFRKQNISRRLKDGDVVDLGKGIQLKVVHLPGHSLGSVGFLWEKEGILFSGDSAMGQGSRPGIL
ncbi:MAG: MBL fold metallo-hydrolase, partial [Dehalococcoidia bacterium]|nr:MBL fold metallo-hydrolase [Dehalococcoidia bacterium]